MRAIRPFVTFYAKVSQGRSPVVDFDWQEEEQEEEEEERESTSWWEVARAALPYTQCNAIFRLLCRTPAIVDTQYTMVQITQPTYTPDIFLNSHLLNTQCSMFRQTYPACRSEVYAGAPATSILVQHRLEKQGLE